MISALDVESASALFAHRPDHRDAGHGGRAWRRSRPSSTRRSRRATKFRPSPATARRSASAISASCPDRPRKRAKRPGSARSRGALSASAVAQWPIKLETDFIIKRKLKASLEGAGASLDSVVKAQVYLSDREDVPAFNEVWLSHFKTPPATTIIATAIAGFRHQGSADRDQHHFARDEGQDQAGGDPRPEPPLFDGWVSAVKCRRSPVPVGADGGRRRTPDRGSARRCTPAVLWHSGQGRTAFHHPAGRGDLPRGRHLDPECCAHPAIPHRSCRSAGGDRGLGRDAWITRRCRCRDRGALAAGSRRARAWSIFGCMCRAAKELTEWIDERRVHPGRRGRIFGFQSLSLGCATAGLAWPE